MKKFITNKFAREKKKLSLLTHAAKPPPPPNLEEIVRPQVQTPTAINRPQPDVIIHLNVTTKDKNDEYRRDVAQGLGFSDQEMSNNDEEATNLSKSSIVCRDFVRGVCKRRGCKFAHKYESSSPIYSYIFCRDFQNKTCTYTNCIYVHASISEEQKYYRTGQLPSYVQTYNKRVIMQPPLPPSPVPPMPPVPPIIPPVPQTHMYTNMPPPVYQSTMTSAPMPTICSSSTATMPMLPHQCVPDLPHVMNNAEEMECDDCELVNLKLQWYINKIQKRKNSVRQLMKNLTDTKKKNKLLDFALMTVFKIKGWLGDTSSARVAVGAHIDADMPD